MFHICVCFEIIYVLSSHLTILNNFEKFPMPFFFGYNNTDSTFTTDNNIIRDEKKSTDVGACKM